MLAEDADLASYRLVPSERAYHAVDEAETCALCGASELERTASERDTFEWVKRFDAGGYALSEAVVAEPFAARAGSVHPNDWEEIRSRAATDSRLAPVYPWQLDSTDAIVAEVVDTDLERIAVDEFLFPICGRCSADDRPPASSVVRRAYVDFKFDGNELAAAAQRQWRHVEQFLDVLSRIAQQRSA